MCNIELFFVLSVHEKALQSRRLRLYNINRELCPYLVDTPHAYKVSIKAQFT